MIVKSFNRPTPMTMPKDLVYKHCKWYLPSLIADRRHSLFGHICRLPENTPASQALQLSIEAHTGTPPATDWKCPTGCPRRTWLQQVEEDIGLSVGAPQIASQDRSTWRMLRPSAGQAQQWVSEWVNDITHNALRGIRPLLWQQC